MKKYIVLSIILMGANLYSEFINYEAFLAVDEAVGNLTYPDQPKSGGWSADTVENASLKAMKSDTPDSISAKAGYPIFFSKKGLIYH